MIQTNYDSENHFNANQSSAYSPRSFDSSLSYHNEDSNKKLSDSDSDANQIINNIDDMYQQNRVSTVIIKGASVISLYIDGKERLCLAQISNTLLKEYTYNEIHNRRVALGINCIQCTPVQLEILRRAGAMPVSSRRCGMITKREAERLVKSFLEENKPLALPENFVFNVYHKCGWGCRGVFYPSRYNSSRAKCICCFYCNTYYSPNKFIFHAHNTPDSVYIQPDTANFNSWRRHLILVNSKNDDDLSNAWEDVKAIFNGGTRKRSICPNNSNSTPSSRSNSPEIDKYYDLDIENQIEKQDEIEDKKYKETLTDECILKNENLILQSTKKEKSFKGLLENSNNFFSKTANNTFSPSYSEVKNTNNYSVENISQSYNKAIDIKQKIKNQYYNEINNLQNTSTNNTLIAEPQQTNPFNPVTFSHLMSAAAAASIYHSYIPIIPSLTKKESTSSMAYQLPSSLNNDNNNNNDKVNNMFPFMNKFDILEQFKIQNNNSQFYPLFNPTNNISDAFTLLTKAYTNPLKINTQTTEDKISIKRSNRSLNDNNTNSKRQKKINQSEESKLEKEII